MTIPDIRLVIGRGLSPEVLNFLPYSKAQLVEIIKSRIRQLPRMKNGKPILEPLAIDLCAAKVTAHTRLR